MNGYTLSDNDVCSIDWCWSYYYHTYVLFFHIGYLKERVCVLHKLVADAKTSRLIQDIELQNETTSIQTKLIEKCLDLDIQQKILSKKLAHIKKFKNYTSEYASKLNETLDHL